MSEHEKKTSNLISRRGIITGLVSLVAAPAIMRVAPIMPVKVMEPIKCFIDIEAFDFATKERQFIVYGFSAYGEKVMERIVCHLS